MTLSAASIPEASADVGSMALVMPEDKRSSFNHQRFIMLAEKEITFTVWKLTPIKRNFIFGLIFHTINAISFSAKVMNLWWLKLDLLSSGIVKPMEPITEDASATDDAETDIIVNRTKLVKKE
ncbi:hypothetical protein TNIN_351881 [Trichonephila inaurata madagascariensis]|uniref:Uncharacterized protein n=1 Tax=Trichonephila inaurata madagascariensis TaxID=2747483 RepID=A0A8X7CI17_9ARAC|nr:hypothetical protein TNIN_351881 [Trichonephila inaurata madagascariensis]